MPDFSNLIDMGLMIFIMMGIGIFQKRRNVITQEVRRGMTNIVLYCMLPCNIIMSFQLEFDHGLLMTFLKIFAIAAVAQVINQLFSMILYRKEPEARRAVLRYGTIITSAGFFGIAVVEGIYGATGLLFAAIYQIPQRIAMWTSGISCFNPTKQKGALRKVFLHPCMVAVYIGMAVMVFAVPIPHFLDTTLRSLGGCTIPTTMLLTGAILAEVDPKSILNRTTLFFTFIRMLVIPGLILGGCLAFHIEPIIAGIAVIMSGMPAGTTTGLMAAQYGGDEKLASMCIIVSTIFAIVMIPFWCYIVMILA